MDIETIRAEALRKLGRNVVNFAKIEACLKYLLAASQVAGTPKTISKYLRKSQTRLRKQTLGRLVQEFNQNILGEADQVDSSVDFSELEMSSSFKVTYQVDSSVDFSELEMSSSFEVTYSDPEFSKVQKRAFLAIVAERNKLIHQDLADLDTTSVEDYSKLITLLDEQNPRLLAHLEELRGMINSLRKGQELVQSFTKLPEFLQYIQSSQTDL